MMLAHQVFSYAFLAPKLFFHLADRPNVHLPRVGQIRATFSAVESSMTT